MPQHDYIISNDTGANVRSDINSALATIVQNNSGTTAPSTTYPSMSWADTTTGLLKFRNQANSSWITVGDLNRGNTFYDFYVGGSEVARIDSGGRLGIGLTSPGIKLDVAASASLDGVRVQNSYAGANGATLTFRSSRGSVSAPTATQSGDVVGLASANGYGTSGWTAAGYLRFVAAENFTNTAGGTYVQIACSATGSASPRVVFYVGADGDVTLPTHLTTASAANANLDSVTGSLRRSVSSLRYKHDLRPLDGAIDIVKHLAPITYRSNVAGDDPSARHLGFIAEHSAPICRELVNFNAEGQPEGFNYDRMTVVLTAAVQRLIAEIEAIKGSSL